MSGKLIVFEGVEGCGKTTQLQQVQLWLDGYGQNAIATREPGGTNLGLDLRKILLNNTTAIDDTAELLLYTADRAQHVAEVIKPQLAQGAMILCDRYVDSTIAYQGYGRSLSHSLITQLNYIATGGLESDLTIWLDIDVELSLARKGKEFGNDFDRIEQENLAFHRRVQQGYTELATANPNRIVRVDASLSKVEVQAQIQAILRQRFPEIQAQG